MPVQIIVRLATVACTLPGYWYATGRAATERSFNRIASDEVQHEDGEQPAAGDPQRAARGRA